MRVVYLSIIFVLILKYNANSQNIALGKPYIFSNPPNYLSTSKDPNRKILTDGNYSNAFFWATEKSIGWANSKRITVELDLLKSDNIGSVSFNTARSNKSGVFYPSNIFVFISLDNFNYSYIGDLAENLENKPGDYEIRKFVIPTINQVARFIKLIIIPKGTFVFCDEIEVFRSTLKMKYPDGSIRSEELGKRVDYLLRIDNENKKVASQIKAIKTVSPGPIIGSNKKRDLNSELTRLKIIRRHSLRSKFGTDIIIDKVNPWSELLFPHRPLKTINKPYEMVVMIGGVQYGSFVVTNLYDVDVSFKFSLQFPATDINSLEFFQVPYVISGNDYREVADPLILQQNEAIIHTGESKVFFFKVTGKMAGSTTNKILIKAQNYSSALAVNVRVANFKLPSTLSLNANNWAYFNAPLIKERKKEALTDLFDHHINTLVVPPYVLPYFTSESSASYLTYVKDFMHAKNILLFMDVKGKLNRSAFKNSDILSEAWKKNFIRWYNRTVSVSKSIGIGMSKLYVYPFDEIEDKDVNDFVIFLKWLKVNHPRIKTFGTLTSIKAVKCLTPLLTISQVLEKSELTGLGDKNNIWTYSVNDHAESLSPYLYRMKSWKAFYYDNKGIGFWNYADYRNGSNNKSELQNFDGVNSTNYSVIYSGPGKTILSTRRWEAFKMGIEDYELLSEFSKKYGILRTKQLVSKVVNSPQNVSFIDEVRNYMLKSLIK